jgi:hypothetical protein
MAEDPRPQKVPLIFFRTLAGGEPVLDWLRELQEAERQPTPIKADRTKSCCYRR